MKIRLKVFLLGLLLPVVALCGFAYWAFLQMGAQATYTIQASQKLGQVTSDKSGQTLLTLGRDNILNDVRNRARSVDERMRRIENTVQLLAKEAEFCFKLIPPKQEIAYFTHEKSPDDPHANAVIRTVEGEAADAVGRDIALTSPLDSMFAGALKQNSAIRAVYVGTEHGVHRRLPWTASHRAGYDPRSRSWYQGAKDSHAVHWTELYVSASEEVLMVTCSAPVYGKDGKLCGVVGADVGLDEINSVLLTNVTQDAFAVLLDASGSVVAEPGIHKGGQAWDKAFKSDDWSKSKNPLLRQITAELKRDQSGVKRGQFREQDMLLAYARIPSNEWGLCMVLPVDRLTGPVEEIRTEIATITRNTRDDLDAVITHQSHVFLLCLAAVLAVFLVIALRVAATIVKPVKQLAEGARQIGAGDFNFQLQIRSGDEIEELAQDFNRMAAELKQYMANLEKTTAEKERIQSELSIATEIQAGMLPNLFPPFPDRKELDIFACMVPAREVGGDFYDFFFVDENRFCFLVGDVSGKGVPAALFMAISKAMLQSQIRAGESVGAAFNRFNQALSANNPELLFVTLFVVVVDLSTGEVEYIDAGHNPPMVLRNGQDGYAWFADETVKGPMAGIDESAQYGTGMLRLAAGERIVLYTDGVTEAFNPAQEEFGDARLSEALSACGAGLGCRTTCESLMQSVRDFASGAEQSDDITIVCFEYQGKA